MSTNPGSFIELLRATTKSEHSALERTPMMASLMNKDLSVADYTQVLLVFARLYATLDPLLIAATQNCQVLDESYQYHARLPFLQRDLSALRKRLNSSLDWQPATLAQLFSGRQDPSLHNCAQAQSLTQEQTLGLVYVIEGSSQGGKIIAPRLAKQLQLTNNTGLSFFHHFAFQATDWPVLRQQLSALPAEGGNQQPDQLIAVQPQPVCDAACSMFQALTELMAQPQTISA
ncbi:MAG: biliverdin-producing heme oxygenase [Idiomarina sp.]|nr:biliverdin-producing heme oxygenase [Idiomarina sp.]